MNQFLIGDLVSLTGSNKIGIVLSFSQFFHDGDIWYNVLLIENNMTEAYTADWLRKVS